MFDKVREIMKTDNTVFRCQLSLGKTVSNNRGNKLHYVNTNCKHIKILEYRKPVTGFDIVASPSVKCNSIESVQYAISCIISE